MEKEMSKTHVSIVIVFLIGIALGAVFGMSLKKTNGQADCSSLQKENDMLRAQVEKAKSMFPASAEMKSVSGAVKSISGNTITIVTSGSPNPFEDIPTQREVLVADSTKLVELVQKDPAIYNEELKEYSKSPTGPLPSPSEEKTISLKDILPNDTVVVDVATNIKMSARFEATKITVSRILSAVAGGASSLPPPAAPELSSEVPLPPPAAPELSSEVPLPPPSST